MPKAVSRHFLCLEAKKNPGFRLLGLPLNQRIQLSTSVAITINVPIWGWVETYEFPYFGE
jgi:hypothetical protein